ncbi:MAG: cation transporter dimerization domain-containing protein, partial [Alphaproteobacteria bacterium]
TNSEALAADALHFGSDLISSSLVLLGLAAEYLGYPEGDAFAAIGVAIFIGIAGYRLGRRTIDTLMDAVPENMPEKIREIVDRQTGVVSVDAVRARRVGATIFADLEISVARTLSLNRVKSIKDTITAALTKELGQAEITVVTTPRALDDETVLERVLHVATIMERHIHHVTVQHIGERLSVSLDLEVDGRLPLKAGHAIATDLETAIAAELGEDIEVETHIEPQCMLMHTGANIPANQLESIHAALEEEAAKNGIVSQIHNVRARETAEGLVVYFHCGVNPELSVAAVHEHVDTVERAVRQKFPDIIQVIGHAEPAQ